MSRKTVLITGCSSGIGLALAVKMATDEWKRYTVIATMRSLDKRGPLEEAAGAALGSTLLVRQLDVCSDASVRDCLAAVPGGRVDVLVNNAGVGLIGPVEGQSMDEIRAVFDTNFFGVVRMIKAVLPDMKRRRSGHIVVISSVMGLQGIVFNDVYAASKFAVEGFCESLVIQTLQFNVHLSLMEPGPVITEFESKVLESAACADYSSVDADTARMFTRTYLGNCKAVFASIGQTADEVAELTARVVSAEKPPFRCQTNPLYTPFTALKHADPTGELAIETFSKMIFQHDRLFQASMQVLKFMRARVRGVKVGGRRLGL